MIRFATPMRALSGKWFYALTATLLMVVTVPVSVLAAGEDFTFLTENARPTNYLNDQGELVGSSTEIVTEILKRLDWSSTIEIQPWSRAYQAALQGPRTALFSTTRTAEREPLFKWVGPIFEQRQILYKKASSPLTINNLDEAKAVAAIGTYYNDAAEQYLKSNGFDNIQSTPQDALNIHKLMLDRIQLWATGEASLANRLAEAGYRENDVAETFILQKIHLYIAFSKDTDDAIIAKWQDTLDQIKNEGLYRQLLEKYSNIDH